MTTRADARGAIIARLATTVASPVSIADNCRCQQAMPAYSQDEPRNPWRGERHYRIPNPFGVIVTHFDRKLFLSALNRTAQRGP